VITFVSRFSYAICLLSLALVGPAWALTPQTGESDASLYARAVEFLNQAEQQLAAKDLPKALAAVKKSNAIFTQLQKKSAAILKDRQLSSGDTQQLAINEKLAADAQTQADKLFVAAAAKKKQAMETQGVTEATQTALRESREESLKSQALSIKAAIYALRNQQIIFRSLAP
jgi:hypothetical protein